MGVGGGQRLGPLPALERTRVDTEPGTVTAGAPCAVPAVLTRRLGSSGRGRGLVPEPG